MTVTSSTIAVGTSSSTITLTSSGTYTLSARANLFYNGATFAANQVVTLNLYRQNNTPGVVPNSQTQETAGIVSGFTQTFGDFNLPLVVYTTANTNDVISLRSSITAAPAAGSFDVREANLVAIRIQ